MQMEGREPLWAWVTAAVIAAGGIANLVDTTGRGAPAHPVAWPSYVGLLLAAGLVASTRARNRLLSPFVAIFAAFFVTLERGPDSLSFVHIVVLFAAVGFAVALTMRQRRAQKALGATRSPAGRRGRGRGRDDEQPAVGRPRKPTPNRRYTPPKSSRTASSSRRSGTTRH